MSFCQARDSRSTQHGAVVMVMTKCETVMVVDGGGGILLPGYCQSIQAVLMFLTIHTVLWGYFDTAA